MSLHCPKCNRDFKTKAEMDEHNRIYFYAETHDADGLEKTVSYLYSVQKTDKEANQAIWKEYDILERKYHELLGVLGKHRLVDGRPDTAINELYRKEAEERKTVFEPVNKSAELLLLLQQN